MKHLILCEHVSGEIKESTLNTIAAAKAVGTGDLELLICGHNLSDLADKAKNIANIDTVLVCDNAALEHPMAEDVAKVISTIAKDYSHVWAPASTFGKNILPRAAALLDVQQISEISAVLSENQFQRPIYAGNAVAVVESNEPIHLITVRATAFEAVSNSGGNANIENIEASELPRNTNLVNLEGTPSERPELSSAKVIVSGGRGMAAKENFSMIEKVADHLGAAVGASRAAVDAGYAPNDWQVGQTGKVVAPEVYLAVGISGAIQHLAGMKDSKKIVVINKDEEAPIFHIADYGLVADLFDALPELDRHLSK